MKSIMTITEFSEKFGVTPGTVRKWENNGVLTPKRTAGGHRRYSEAEIEAVTGVKTKYRHVKEVQRNVIYCRISNPLRLDDLERQASDLKMFALGRGLKTEIISEIGDGRDLERPLFRKLLDDIMKGEIATVIVKHQNRLLHTGFELLESMAKASGCEIISINME